MFHIVGWNGVVGKRILGIETSDVSLVWKKKAVTTIK
jgi:hypothetical protein